MATQEKHVIGAGGSITLPTGFKIAVKSWSAQISPGATDTSEIGDVWDSIDAATCRMTGACVGDLLWDAAATNPVPLGVMGASPTMASWKGTATFIEQTGCQFTGTFMVTNVTFTRDRVSGTGSYQFHSDGVVNINWDVTT